VSVVVIDTGLDLNHPFFGPDADGDGVADRIVFHYDFADRNADARDLSGHGSHVTSIIASQDARIPVWLRESISST
jgi:subtilisin family serine protease